MLLLVVFKVTETGVVWESIVVTSSTVVNGGTVVGEFCSALENGDSIDDEEVEVVGAAVHPVGAQQNRSHAVKVNTFSFLIHHRRASLMR